VRPLRAYDAAQSERRLRLQGLPLAPFWRRAAALLVDFLLAGLLFLVIFALVGRALARLQLHPGSLAWKILEHLAEVREVNGHPDINFHLDFFHNLLSVVWLVAYFSLAHSWGRGRSPGKSLLGIRVLSLDHEHLGFWHCVERALGYGASALEAGFGFFQYFLDRNRRTVHDRIAETIVVREPRPRRKKVPADSLRSPRGSA